MKRILDKWKSASRSTRLMVVAVTVFIMVLVTMIPVTYAWFTRQKQIAFLSEVDTPQELYIRAGHEEDTAFIDLSNIDVEEENNSVTSKDFVFCVKGDVTQYYIQLAHTTNIEFNYSMYCADEKTTLAAANTAATNTTLVANDPAKVAVYTSHEIKEANGTDAKKFYYAKTAILNGSYINLQSNGFLGIQEDEQNNGDMKNQHPNTYEDYIHVQKNAEPLYWHSTKVNLGEVSDDEKEAGEYARYYILHLDWTGKGLTNNKETDLVYITVASAQSLGEE